MLCRVGTTGRRTVRVSVLMDTLSPLDRGSFSEWNSLSVLYRCDGRAVKEINGGESVMGIRG